MRAETSQQIEALEQTNKAMMQQVEELNALVATERQKAKEQVEEVTLKLVEERKKLIESKGRRLSQTSTTSKNRKEFDEKIKKLEY